MEDAGSAKKRRLELDWDKLLPDRDDGPVTLTIIKGNGSIAQPRKNSDMASDQRYPLPDGIELKSVRELKDCIQRQKATLAAMAAKLPDGGEKCRNTIKQYEEELERREMRQPEAVKEADEFEKPRQVTSSTTVGVCSGLRQQNILSVAHSQSSFASCFSKRMEDARSQPDCKTVNAFDKELSLFKHCNSKMRDNEFFSQKGRKKDQSYSRQYPSHHPSNFYKSNKSDDNRRCRGTSPFTPHCIQSRLSSYSSKRMDAPQPIQLDGSKSKKGQPIVLDDDDDDDDDNDDNDESHLLDKTEQEDKLAEHLREVTIYYPSRDDPESVEILYKNLDCLSPEGYLSSTIMNFYIQYLQQQAFLTDRSVSDYHFFNTYFYKKLTEAVSCKQSEREGFFVKFRRWWKGVNIFQNAYILIPIHDNLHWSLIIVCIPNKEDQSGPIILHLDSLGLHSSRSIFENIRSFLREEWNYLVRERLSSDIPIADRIWKYLPGKIEQKVIDVPQQKNEYDCGLFVLYFIERFIEDAPERLKMKDLAMFGKQWFRPEEASGLRIKIRKLLRKEFQNSCEHYSTA